MGCGGVGKAGPQANRREVLLIFAVHRASAEDMRPVTGARIHRYGAWIGRCCIIVLLGFMVSDLRHFYPADIETMETLIRPYKVHESAIPFINYKQPAASENGGVEEVVKETEPAGMEEVCCLTIEDHACAAYFCGISGFL